MRDLEFGGDSVGYGAVDDSPFWIGSSCRPQIGVSEIASVA